MSSPTTPSRNRTLYRDTEHQKLGGVCSGLARYFDLDPLLVRVAFVAGLVFSGVTFVAYVLLWWLVDPAPEGFWSERAADAETLPPPATADDTTTDTSIHTPNDDTNGASGQQAA